MADKSDNRCWPGYEPVPGKAQHEQGSCRPKAESNSTPAEKAFRAKRKKQIGDWKAHHKGSPAKAAQHLHAPGATTKTARKAAPKKAAAKKATSKKSVSGKKSTAKGATAH